jgi:hypothetical protein
MLNRVNRNPRDGAPNAFLPNRPNPLVAPLILSSLPLASI